MEREALAKVLQADKESIIATGGGVVLSSKNRELMKASSVVIWLGASPEILAARITGDSNRPLLTDVDPLSKMKALSLERAPLYEEVADLYVDTGKLTDEQAVAKILDFLSE
jgi:shikimate kinase